MANPYDELKAPWWALADLMTRRLCGDQLGKMSAAEIADLRNGNHNGASKELVEAAHNLQGCEWLG